MNRLFLCFLLSFSWCVVATAESRGIEWSDLIDQDAQTYDDPYRNLSYSQIDNLRKIVRLRAQLAEGEFAGGARQKIEAKLAEAEGVLKDADINVDWLLEQRWVVMERRKLAATAGNPAVNGQSVSLAGFAIPAPSDPDGTPVVYLVPEKGMCSHTPPPNPNQILRVRIGKNWKPRFMHEPVRLTGMLSIHPTQQTMQIVDGPVAMKSTYQLQANRVETLFDMKNTEEMEVTSEWARGVVSRLRRSGQQSEKSSK